MIGRTLGRYRVLEQIGAGGMGLVFRAHDERLDRDVALKVLPPGTLTDENARRRFRKEALTLSKLNHPNIETVFDFDTEDGVDFLVMELIPGITLDDKLAAGALPEKEVARLGQQLAEGLAAAHAEGVVHRDLKPGNLRLTPDGRLKILDFGLAKLLQPSTPDAATESLSKTRGTAGTLPYMAPEQLQGQAADARSDLWAAGAVLYELATAKRPFPQASGPMLTDAILRQAPVTARALNASLSPELDRIVGKALEKDPEHRYQSALELRADLMRLKRDSDSGPQTLSSPAPRPWGLRRRGAIGLGLLALAVVLGAGALFLRSRQAKGSIDSIAVLPFVNVGADPNTEYLSDGISESLINSLSELPHLRVMSRNSVARYKGREVDAQAAGRELKVQAVLTGRVRQRGQNLSVSVELVDVANNSHLWGEDYDRNLTGALSIQQEITRNIADQLRRKLSGEDEKRLAKRSTTNPEAYRLYLQGRYYVEKYTYEGVHKGSEYFEKAIDLDPSYALAYTGLAYANWVSDDFILSPAESMPRGREAAAKALELDDTLPEAHMQMGIIHLVYDFDWPGAERELRRAIELKPDYALAHEYYGWYLVTLGRFEEGIRESKRGVELEPLSAEVGGLAAQNYYFALRSDLAIDQLHKTLEMDPDFMFGHFILGPAYEAKGDYPRAILEMRRAHELEKSLPWALSMLGHAYAVSGRRREAEQVLKELEDWSRRRYVPAYNFAEVYVGLGKKEEALAALEKAYEDRSMTMTFITTDPRFDSLRSEPRFKDLMQRLNLPQ